MKRVKSFKKRAKIRVICILILLVGVLGAVFVDEDSYARFKIKLRHVSLDEILAYFDIKTNQSLNLPEGEVCIFELDVSQGKSILVKSGKHAMLIDAGDTQYGGRVADFLRQKGQKKLDYLVVTHPHSDHVGGAATVIKDFEIGEILMPKLTKKLVPVTPSFNKFLGAVKRKKVKLRTPEANETLKLGKAKIEIVSLPGKKYKSLNNISLVTKISYKGWSFLSTGDIEKAPERDLVKNSAPIASNILDVAHHGGKTSTSQGFLQAVSPDVALISVGENDYGHSSKEVLRRLDKNGVGHFTTQAEGTLQVDFFEDYYCIFNSHGQEIFKKAA